MTDQPGGVRYNDRVLVLGQTGSGKSELLNYLAAALRTQRLLLDTKAEFALPDVEAARAPEAIDWAAPVVHYVDDQGGASEMEELFDRCWRRRALVVVAHELADVCDYRSTRTPRAFDRYVSKGRARGLGLFAASQRPVQVPSRARSEAEHVFLIGPRFTLPADHETIAATVGMEKGELAELVDRTQEQLGHRAFLWWQRRTRQMTAYPPLPEHLRRRIGIRRLLDA